MHKQVLHIFLFSGCCLASFSISAASVNSLTEEASMSFATIIGDPFGDNITLTPSGSISGQNGSIFTGSPVSAEFSVKGDNNTAVSISFSTGDTLTGSGDNMPLSNFTHDAGTSPAFNGAGNLFFNVGATLTINAGQAGGSYSGLYTVTVDYP